MFGIKLYKEWREAKGVFVKPTLKFKVLRNPYFQHIRLYKKTGKAHQINSASAWIYIKKEGRNSEHYGSYIALPKHKLPVPLYSIVWNSKIRRKLRKFGLGWIPPVITVPTFLTFGIRNWGLGYKIKYNDFRYEHDPLLDITLFGITFRFYVQAPKSKYGFGDNYWECMLEYLYGEGKRDIFKTLRKGNFWTQGFDETALSYFSLRPEYVINQQEYKDAVEKLKTINEKYKNVL